MSLFSMIYIIDQHGGYVCQIETKCAFRGRKPIFLKPLTQAPRPF
jgi:hypothetical protein